MTENGTTVPKSGAAAGADVFESKGKGKGVEEPVDTAMEEDNDDDDEEDENEEGADEEEEEDEDNMEEIDTSNIMGRRTRGRVIDFAKAAEENPPDADDDDEDDDFQAPDEDTKMKE